MFDYVTQCVNTARTNAWIDATLIFTRSIAGTFRVNDTFWPTVWRPANVIWQTCAGSVITNGTALAVGATGIINTGIFRGALIGLN